MKLNRIVTLSLLSLLVTGCWEGDTHYFKRIAAYREPWNPVRERRNIPIIPTNWVVRADRSAVAWDNPDFRNGRNLPMHQYKFLTFTGVDSGTVLEETDHYESGRRWVDRDAGTMHEYVRITYCFDLERRGELPWKAEVLQNGFSPKHIRLSEAEQILNGWGIDRLKFNTQRQEIAQPDGAARDSRVASDSAFAALHRLVEQAHLPSRPGWSVRVESSKPKNIIRANAGRPRQLPMRTRWATRIAQFGRWIEMPNNYDA